MDVLLAGPIGTPYVGGVWRLHLEIPPTYPTAPPTATFRTRLWHPNIDEATGAVCVETLKRDWSSTLKLRDVLVTISCLLIQPNPASALNEAAGKLASEDWDGFCRRAKLMTDIHAAVPKELVDGVREAQMRGEEPVDKEAVKKVDGTGVESVKAASASAGAKKVQHSLAAEDEENRRRRGDTVEPESDPESDWIPGPGSVKSSKVFASGRTDNIFGIKGLDVQLDSTPKKINTTVLETSNRDMDENEENDNSDPFITIPAKHVPTHSFKLRVPQPAPSSKIAEEPSDATPDLLRFSHQNPFSAIQPNNQQHPMIKEFSWSWQESEILHDTGMIKDGTTKADVRKRMAGEEFEKRRNWELKKFRKTGYDLKKYNRGDFGPRIGIHRL